MRTNILKNMLEPYPHNGPNIKLEILLDYLSLDYSSRDSRVSILNGQFHKLPQCRFRACITKLIPKYEVAARAARQPLTSEESGNYPIHRGSITEGVFAKQVRRIMAALANILKRISFHFRKETRHIRTPRQSSKPSSQTTI